jgi:hypothetical protein
LDLRQRIADGEQDAVNLGVFVDEEQAVGDVVVAHVLINIISGGLGVYETVHIL